MENNLIEDDIIEILNRIKKNISELRNKTVLITGGGGFIGSWLCDIFLKLNSKVVCVDNFSSGIKDNIQHLENEKNFELIKADVRNFSFDKKCDYVLHLAGRASPDDYQNHQIDTLLTNSEGIKTALEITKANKCRMLFSSTSEVYGDAQILPTSESYWGNVNSFGPRSCYDEGKRYGEALCYAYQKEFDLDIRIVRIFNTFGPRIRPDGPYGRALSRFILQAMKEENITIYGDGLQTRSFCYISDTITGILLNLASKENCGILNLGSEHEITINQLAEKIKEQLKSPSKIIHLQESQDDPRKRRPDISKAQSVLGWKPEVTFDSGLEKTIRWIKKNSYLFS